MSDHTAFPDPRSQYPGPQSQAEETIEYPGETGQMTPPPDHGEDSYRGSGRLEGRRAVVTGGDSGIGRAVALAFAREGADVVITHLADETADAKRTAQLVEAEGRAAVTVEGDIRDEAHCRAVVERAVAELGGIDILVNNAAYQMALPGGLADLSTEQLRRTFETNVFAMVWLTQAALPHLKPGASIINTTSIQAFNPAPPLIDYAMTKAAILNFTRSLSQQLAPEGIRVNAVAPGPIWTPLIPATMPADKAGQFGADTPLGRAGQPAEVAPAFVFLASAEAGYVSGEYLAVTGGKLT